MINWYCWFCQRKVNNEEVHIATKGARQGKYVYTTHWGSIHTARKEHWRILKITGVVL